MTPVGSRRVSQLLKSPCEKSSREYPLYQALLYKESVPYTTRAPRPGEIEGRSYHFVSYGTFTAMIQADLFVEHGELKGELYGTLKPGAKPLTLIRWVDPKRRWRS